MSEPARLGLSVGAERATGRLRLVAGIVVGIGAIWLIALGPDTIGWLLALMGGLASLGWVMAFRRSRRRIAQASRWYLAVDADGLQIAKGGEPTRIPWADVTGTRVDEDRLNVVVERRDAPKVVIEPMWAELGVYDLHEVIVSWRASAGAIGGSRAPAEGDPGGSALPVGARREHD